jgi:serine/threonine protein kinase
MAPEAMFTNNDSSCTAAVDIWALGQTVFYMMTTQLAFSGGETGEIYNYLTGGSFPKTLLDGASGACGDFVARAMASTPGKRPEASTLLKHEWLSLGANTANPNDSVSQELK